ncbi:ELMO domain-containing protein C [Durusdinium trenchii]|uniref:ELMO domain-containing protein C n=1 Tax=Durusdinium trenchii TaxID=1381693 RepID=A0ABP0Q8S6_9DINO
MLGTVAGEDSLGSTSPRWRQLGFQSNDPRSDLRTGLLALDCLVFMAERYPLANSQMIREAQSTGIDYPFAVASINVTQHLARYLHLVRDAVGCALDIASPRTVHRFAGLLQRQEEPIDVTVPFCELHAAVMTRLHCNWRRRKREDPQITVMSFAPVLEETLKSTRRFCEGALMSSSSEFRSWVDETEVRDGAEPPLSVPSVAFRPEEEIWVDGVEEHNTLLTKDNVEVIVPLHRLVKLGYRLQWTSAGVKITHPQSGRIECALRGGCPVLSEKQALALLDIMEKEDKGELMLDEEIRNWWSSRFPDVPQEVWNHMRGPHGYGEDQPSRSRAVERGRAALAEAGCRSYAAVEASAEGALGHASEESQGYRVRLQGYEKRGETGTIEGSWTRALAGEGLIEEDPSQMPVWLGIETAVTGGNREPEDTDSSHSRGSFEKV